MRAEPELERVVRSWLQEEGHEDAERVLFTVLNEVDTTPQRHAGWLARRFQIMSAYLRVGAVAAAVLLAVVIGIQLVSGEPNVFQPGPPATSSPSVSPSSSPEPWVGPLQVGRNEAEINGVRFSFHVPEGWTRTQFEGMIRAQAPPYKWVGFLNAFDSVASEPCTGATTAVGSSVTDMAEALTTIPGTEAEVPTDAIVGGLPAKLVTLSIDDDIDCAPSSFWIYGPNSAYPNGVKSTIKIWVFELDGTRYSIHSDQVESDADGAQEIADIVASITFE